MLAHFCLFAFSFQQAGEKVIKGDLELRDPDL